MLDKKTSRDANFEGLKLNKWEDIFTLELYDTRVLVKTDNKLFKQKLAEHLPFVKQNINLENSANTVSLLTRQSKTDNGLFFNDESAMIFTEIDDKFFEYAADKILMIMAMISLPSKIYLHAGAVVWKDMGILLPGTSYAGKTTLVREFIKAGAVYYSDDCIILDGENNMLPFPRDLAIRTSGGRIFRNAGHFGSRNGVEKTKISLIIHSNYQDNAVWEAQNISPGESVLKLMDNFYYRPAVGSAPLETMKNLSNLTKGVISVAGERGEAQQVINWVSENFSDVR